jgi:hypothetical protein
MSDTPNLVQVGRKKRNFHWMRAMSKMSKVDVGSYKTRSIKSIINQLNERGRADV